MYNNNNNKNSNNNNKNRNNNNKYFYKKKYFSNKETQINNSSNNNYNNNYNKEKILNDNEKYFKPIPQITNYPNNPYIYSYPYSYYYPYNLYNNSLSIVPYNANRSSLILSEFNDIIKKYISEVEKISEKVVKREYKWINLNINTLNDLIQVCKDYGTKYEKEYDYQIDLNLLSSMINELEELNKLIGLSNIKNQIIDLILYYALKLDNKNYDLLHTVIEGEPGTGKTELAEKLAKIYLKMGILKNNVFKKVKRSDLIAGYLGQTAIKTEKILEECKGGVLFIDEAYSLGNADGKEGKDSFSKECIDMINQWLTENKSEFICIIAGYADDLSKSFFSYNNGLERRFPIRFKIDNYTDEELANIFIKKIKEYDWNIDCSNINNIIKSNRKYFKFNGGDMEVLFSKCKITHSKNLLKEENKIKKILTENDINDGIKLFINNPLIKKRGEENINKYLANTMYT
jgi:AAA+ superfamily predicted ATPase